MRYGSRLVHGQGREGRYEYERKGLGEGKQQNNIQKGGFAAEQNQYTDGSVGTCVAEVTISIHPREHDYGEPNWRALGQTLDPG